MPNSIQNWRRAGRAIVQAAHVLAGKQIAGRNLTVYPDDVLLVSYPRSGNTWTRFLLGNLINPHDPVTFANIESRIPEIYFNSDHVMRSLPRPRLLKSHECFQPHYRNIIYIVRDPRDVAVSFYHHNIKAGNIPDDYPMQNFVPRFIQADFDTKWGSWSDNVRSWLSLRQGQPGFILLRYEDIKWEPVSALRRIGNFLREHSFSWIDTSSEALERAVELSSAQRMREMEKQQAKRWILTRNTRHDKPFVRSATSGEWKSRLPEESVASIEQAWGNLMRSLGYQLHIAIVPADGILPEFVRGT